jgi:hypothetical protein
MHDSPLAMGEIGQIHGFSSAQYVHAGITLIRFQLGSSFVSVIQMYVFLI